MSFPQRLITSTARHAMKSKKGRAWPKTIKFPKKYIKLLIPSVIDRTKEVHFRAPLEMSKPEIKNYLTQLYGLEIEAIHTMIYRGKKNRRMRHNDADYKKVVVVLKDYVELEFNDKMKTEIRRTMDKRLNQIKLRKMEAELGQTEQSTSIEQTEEVVQKEENQPTTEKA